MYSTLYLIGLFVVSVARRLLDPLAELVKIDPKHIGVGQYQVKLYHLMISNVMT